MNFKDYSKYRKAYKLNYPTLHTNEQGEIFLNDTCIENLEGKKTWETDDFINFGYNSKNSISKLLSNLYPITFKFRGKTCASIEGVLQGCKYKDKKLQNLVLKYYGLDAYHTRAINNPNFWGNDGILYWQGKAMKRDGEEYQQFLDELYFCASKNLIYKNALLATGDKYLMHHIGRENIKETVLTRYEYELRLNSLRDFVKLNCR